MDYWHKQTLDQPLYPDLIWSQPENKSRAGKLLIISGDTTGFAVAAQAYQTALTAGAGTVRVVLPDFLRTLVPKQIQFELEFAPAVRNGSFAKRSLGVLLEQTMWADAVLLPGGIGRNSETSATLEQFVQKYTGLLIIAGDALDVFVNTPNIIFEREKTLVIADFSQLQKMWHKIAPGKAALTYSLPRQLMVELLHLATLQVASLIVTNHQTTLQVAYQGQVSTTPSEDKRDVHKNALSHDKSARAESNLTKEYVTQEDRPLSSEISLSGGGVALSKPSKIWRVDTAAKAAVWAMQHQDKLFESVTTALVH